MYFLPLGNAESVALVIELLNRGMDCQVCPLGHVCTVKNPLCHSIARHLEGMASDESFPYNPPAGVVPLETPGKDVLEILEQMRGNEESVTHLAGEGNIQSVVTATIADAVTPPLLEGDGKANPAPREPAKVINLFPTSKTVH